MSSRQVFPIHIFILLQSVLYLTQATKHTQAHTHSSRNHPRAYYVQQAPIPQFLEVWSVLRAHSVTPMVRTCRTAPLLGKLRTQPSAHAMQVCFPMFLIHFCTFNFQLKMYRIRRVRISVLSLCSELLQKLYGLPVLWMWAWLVF
jgi:hypothetical protein